MRKRENPGPAGTTLELSDTDSIDSVAYRFGHAPTTLWDHELNAPLRRARTDGRTLAAGDKLFVPPLVSATFQGLPTDAVHRFRVKNTPSMLRFRPYALAGTGLATHFEIFSGGHLLGGSVTDPHGDIVWPLDPDVGPISVRAYFAGFHRDYEVIPRALYPVDTPRGVQQRLQCLGFYQGECSGEMDASTMEALRRFQIRANLAMEEPFGDRVIDAIQFFFGELGND